MSKLFSSIQLFYKPSICGIFTYSVSYCRDTKGYSGVAVNLTSGLVNHLDFLYQSELRVKKSLSDVTQAMFSKNMFCTHCEQTH